MATNFDMNDLTVEQLMALSEIIDDSDSSDIDDKVEEIFADKFYRVAPKDKGKDPFEGQRQFIDEADRSTDPKKPRRLPLNYKGRRGIMPTWKYSERQKAKALLVEEAYQSLLSRGVEGLPPTMGGRWRTDDPQVNAEIKRLENERNPKRPRGRPPKPKSNTEVKVPRGRPVKPKVDAEVVIPKKRGRPPKPKSDAEVKVPKRKGRPPKSKVAETLKPKVKRQTVAERFISQNRIKLSVPANSVITPTGLGKFTIHVDLNKKPTRKAPEVPKGVAPWKPTPKPRERPIPKPRTVLPRERPIPKPRTIFPRERPVPKPRTRKPVAPPKLRKPVKVSKEVNEQPVVVTPKEHEIDPFGTYLEKPSHRKIETAANGAAVTYSITPHFMDPLDQMTASRQVVRGILVNELKRMGGLKYTETIKVRMSKEIGNDKTKKDSIYFKSKTGTATNFEDIESTAAQNQLTILARIETFQNLGSNWIILNIESHYLNIAMYKPLKSSSYMKLPADIINPKCGIINMKNNDNKCFMWSHVRHVRPKARRATTITRQDVEFAENLDYEGIDFPVKISDIDKIERKNSMSISVFGYKGKKQFYPIRNSKTKYDEHMELLLLGDGNGNNHYVLIKDINRMLYSVSGYEHKKHFCLHCLHSCKSEELLEKHRETCIEVNGTQATKLPKEGTKIKFKNHRNSIPAPFVIYADFESILVPEEKKVDSENSEDKSSTDLYQTHKACSFGLKTVCHYDDKYSGEYISYVGEDATQVFLKTVLKESIKCREMVNKIFKKKMVITPEQEAEFWMTRNCSICGNDLGDDRVRDHDHVTGMFRGAAHNMCNLKYRITWKVPVVFHNLRGYDSHLIMQEIGKFKMNINVVPNNMEKYISFSLGKNLVFIDSIQFMASSLEALVSNLSPEDFKIVGKRWKGEDFNLVTQKGVFPYEFLDDISKLNVEGLPSKDKFYSTLYESEVKEEDYQRAQKVWDHFGMKTMRNYHDLYLETDVLLLADVFENFRRTCLEIYKLDPAHYISAPSLSWNAFLKQSGEEIELKEYGDRSKLLFTDTDSLMYEIKTDDVYEDFRRIGKEKDCWDNSDYPKDSPYYSAHNKKVIGKFKDEAEGVPVIEFVGLRSKMYSYVKESGGGGMTAKGVKNKQILERSKIAKQGIQCDMEIQGNSANQGNRSRYKAMHSAVKLNPAFLHTSSIFRKAANLISLKATTLIFSLKSFFETPIRLVKMFVIRCIQVYGTPALSKEEIIIFRKICCTMEIYLLPFEPASDHINLLVNCETARQKCYVILTFSGGGNVLVYSIVQDIKLHNFQIDFSRSYTRIKAACILEYWFNPVGCAPANFGIKCYNLIVMDIDIIFINIIPVRLSSTIDAPDLRDQATRTLNVDTEFARCPDGLNCETEQNNRRLTEENDALKQKLLEKDEMIKEMKSKFAIEEKKFYEMKCEFAIEKRNISKEKILLENKLEQLEDRYGNLEKDYKDTLLDFGRLSVESDSKTNLGKESKTFQKLFFPKPSASLVVNMEGNNSSSHFSLKSTANSNVQPNSVQSEDEKTPLPVLSLPSSSGEQSVDASRELVALIACQDHEQSKGFEAQNQNESSNERPNNESIDVSPDSPPFPTEVHERSDAQPLGLIKEPSSSVSAHVYNIYRLLLLTISDRLLYSDIIKLKEWANEKFSVDSNLSPAKVILQLDQKGAINASDLDQLRVFFESVTRFDLVYLIDEFYNGDYDKLRKLINQHKSIKNGHERVANLNRVHSPRVLLPHNNTPRSPLRSNTVNRVGNVEEFERPSTADENNSVSIVRNCHAPHSNVASTSNSIVSGSKCSTHENSEDVPDCSTVNDTRGGENRVSTNDAPVTTRIINGKKMSNSGQSSSQRRPKSRQPSSHGSHNRPAKCNGPSQRHPGDHFHGPRNDDIQDNWLCNHYKRRCLVKFECCNKYWPCHRCHNNESTCGRKKLKSRDTTMVKCVECGKEQQFGENGQFCVSCDTQFANFYCGLCKHLTGNDDHPYHCDKCGICR
ncbi:Gastrula zinc finger [Paramuricea clavata]|nr:Gastrula zinc finger [Paramuricea clavata]